MLESKGLPGLAVEIHRHPAVKSILACQLGDSVADVVRFLSLDNYAALLHETGRDADAEALEARARVLGAAGERQPAPQR